LKNKTEQLTETNYVNSLNTLQCDRTLKQEFAKLLEIGGDLRWLFDFVKCRKDLDFQIGRYGTRQWISIYRGLTRILTIKPTANPTTICLDAAEKYKSISAELYGHKDTKFHFLNLLEDLITIINTDHHFDRFYNNRKEGYYQIELSRKYGICGEPNDEFAIIDKEVVVGYKDKTVKTQLLQPLQEKYKQLQYQLSKADPIRFGKNLEKKGIGNELDFLALDKDGNLLLIEFKDGSSAAGIYLSPLQIGMYYDIFKMIESDALNITVGNMLKQKKELGLINPNWPQTQKINKIIPVLIISNHHSKRVKSNFNEVLKIIKTEHGVEFLKDLRTYNYTTLGGLTKWQ